MLNFLAILLSFGVVLVNGFTDAPSSIATAVCSGAVKMKTACIICSVLNFVGAILAFLLCPSVAEFVFSIGTMATRAELTICSVLLTVIIFGIACWLLALPSSESHALICALCGAVFAESGVLDGAKRVGDVFIFMLASNFAVLVLSLVVSRLLPRRLAYDRLQLFSCSLNSFMHGWQDGLKLIGIIALLACGSNKEVPFYLAISVSLVLALGSLLGGKRIIKTMGEGIVSLNEKSAFCSDIGSYITLLAFSLFGIPLSTGNVKVFGIVGAGLGEGKKINKKATGKLFACSVATFPICYFLGYLIMKGMLMLFC